jgi:hypothetical protein
MKNSPSYNSKLFLLTVIFYFLILEIVWAVIGWREFQNEPLQNVNFIAKIVDYIFRHWQYELVTFIYKGIAFLVIVGSGNLVMRDCKRSSEKLLNTLLPKRV